jgi:DNA-binding CsgD family transcriptional regulator
MNYEDILKKLINKIIHPLKSGLDLELALKAKLTKKEFKLLKLLAQNSNQKEVLKELKFSEGEFERVEKNLIKKLNQEKIKQAIYSL